MGLSTSYPHIERLKLSAHKYTPTHCGSSNTILGYLFLIGAALPATYFCCIVGLCAAQPLSHVSVKNQWGNEHVG
jgi:hypothetical protein